MNKADKNFFKEIIKTVSETDDAPRGKDYVN